MRGQIGGIEGEARRSALDRYRQLRAQALQYRWYLDVQREALGLRPHPSVDEFYAVPPDIDRALSLLTPNS